MTDWTEGAREIVGEYLGGAHEPHGVQALQSAIVALADEAERVGQVSLTCQRCGMVHAATALRDGTAHCPHLHGCLVRSVRALKDTP